MKKNIYIITIILFVIGGVGHYMFKENKVKNVFDEMYYAQFQSIPKLYTSTSYSKLIRENILKSLPRNVRNHYPDLKNEYYKADALNENEKITLVFYQDEENNRRLQVIGVNYYEDVEENLRFYFIYDIETKELKFVKPDIVSSMYRDTDYSTNDPEVIAEYMQKHDLTEEDLADYQEYFLYEKVLTDWFAHNPKSRFSLDDLGDVEIVETDVYEE